MRKFKKMSRNTFIIKQFVLLSLVVWCSIVKPILGNAIDAAEETTTIEFDLSSRGTLKFGDKCEVTRQCGFAGSICFQNYCTCSPELMSTNHIDKCGKAVSVNETCFFNEQCEDSTPKTECRDGRCICRFEKIPIIKKDGTIECVAIKADELETTSQVNPAMYLILIVMALMFIIICVVLRLFSKARWRENRTIFNTPNPRLMNVSLLRENKSLHGGERRGSKISVRMPSRQHSLTSLRQHSPSNSIDTQKNTMKYQN
ncbi:CLUMA_CG021012, isoform B [Clunio marinus]|uniref:CLUMA_CG021012, isoform B n=1 Tax=Clunio marinus TaxID=568069 RepID=A0A1J1J6V0_9DIPT|nr:CLUMA_CG021012, isoform B [Clunio marinus]